MEEEREYHEETLRLIEANDPSVTELRIMNPGRERPDGWRSGARSFAPRDDGECVRLGEAIALSFRLVKIGFLGDGWRPTSSSAFGRAYRAFLGGLRRNASLRRVELLACDLSGDTGRDVLRNVGVDEDGVGIVSMRFQGCGLGGGGMRNLASAICQFDHLKRLSLSSCSIDDGLARDVVASVADRRRLECLSLFDNRIGRGGCESLASLLLDTGCGLRILRLDANDVDDACATALAGALRRNRTLQVLSVANNVMLTASGWSALFSALCDTASPNDTRQSNHALRYLSGPGEEERLLVPEHVSVCLEYNRGCRNERRVAARKILWVHPSLDVGPFLERSDLGMLPPLMGWFDGAGECARDFGEHVERRKLSSIYQFARAMPVLFVSGW